MLCDDVKRVVYFFLDGSLSERSRQEVDGHMSRCPSCEARIRIQKRLRDFVQRRITRLTAPDHLKTRLVRSIRAFRAEWSQP